MNKQLIIFNCHKINDETITRYQKLRQLNNFDVIWCYDNSDHTLKNNTQQLNIFEYTINDIRKNNHIIFNSFKYYGAEKTEKIFRWLNSDNFILLNTDIVKNYEYVWMIEYDVCYSGDWKDFFEQFSNNNSDFISYRIENVNVEPNWGWTRYVRDEDPSQTDLYRTFMPICRVSNKCIHTVYDFLVHNNIKNNYHHELTWGTSVKKSNLKFFNLEDYCAQPFGCGPANLHNKPNGKLFHTVKDYIKWEY